MKIGRGPTQQAPDLLALLLECHERIRRFAALAVALGEAEALPVEQVRDAAERVRRYFGAALPLHVRDEEESLVPRLGGREAALDRALFDMSAEHVAHREPLARLLSLCEALERDPESLEGCKAELSGLAGRLQREFEAHLAAEEHDVFPAISRYLTEGVQREIVTELRARRAG